MKKHLKWSRHLDPQSFVPLGDIAEVYVGRDEDRRGDIDAVVGPTPSRISCNFEEVEQALRLEDHICFFENNWPLAISQFELHEHVPIIAGIKRRQRLRSCYHQKGIEDEPSQTAHGYDATYSRTRNASRRACWARSRTASNNIASEQSGPFVDG